MAKYGLSNEAKEDLIRIHRYGVEKFGMDQADKYFDTFFECRLVHLYRFLGLMRLRNSFEKMMSPIVKIIR